MGPLFRPSVPLLYSEAGRTRLSLSSCLRFGNSGRGRAGDHSGSRGGKHSPPTTSLPQQPQPALPMLQALAEIPHVIPPIRPFQGSPGTQWRFTSLRPTHPSATSATYFLRHPPFLFPWTGLSAPTQPSCLSSKHPLQKAPLALFYSWPNCTSSLMGHTHHIP